MCLVLCSWQRRGRERRVPGREHARNGSSKVCKRKGSPWSAESFDNRGEKRTEKKKMVAFIFGRFDHRRKHSTAIVKDERLLGKKKKKSYVVLGSEYTRTSSSAGNGNNNIPSRFACCVNQKSELWRERRVGRGRGGTAGSHLRSAFDYRFILGHSSLASPICFLFFLYPPFLLSTVTQFENSRVLCQVLSIVARHMSWLWS